MRAWLNSVTQAQVPGDPGASHYTRHLETSRPLPQGVPGLAPPQLWSPISPAFLSLTIAQEGMSSGRKMLPSFPRGNCLRKSQNKLHIQWSRKHNLSPRWRRQAAWVPVGP